MAVSQKGYDVETCPDRNFVYHSAFQTLKIFQRYSVSAVVPASGTSILTIEHNLGFYAPFIVINNSPNNHLANVMCRTEITIHDRIKQYKNELTIDIDTLFGSAGNTIYFTVYIFYDDFRTVDARNINTSFDASIGSNDIGLRISKDGFDAQTCTDDQLILSSSFFTSNIHKKGIVTGGLAHITHELSYIPSALVYGRSNGGNYIRMCEGMPFYLNPFNGGRTGWFYAIDDNEMICGENYANVSEFSGDWRDGNTFYYIIFKSKVNG